MRNYCFYFPYKLNISKIQEAAKHFKGEHDFKGFMASGSSITNTVRNVYDLKIKFAENELNIEITANGFLYNMVRIIIGTLLNVGTGKISPDEIPDIIKSRERFRAGITVPPQGLYLAKVYYNQTAV